MIRLLKRIGRKVIPKQVFRLAQPYWHGTLATLAHYYYGRPSDKLIVIGITGTKGKTSTAHIIYQLLCNLGAPTGLLSTAIIDTTGTEELNKYRMTQLSGALTHKLLAQMRQVGKQYVVIEVSSEGLAQHRHYGINFDIAVFTNLTPDHIEAHGSFQAYKEAKGLLFKAITKHKTTNSKKQINSNIQKTIIANLDSEYGTYYVNHKADKHVSYGVQDTSANLVAAQVATRPLQTEFSIFNFQFSINLPGLFNVYNVLAATGAAQALGFDLQTISEAAQKLKPIPGRMEILQTKPFTVLVDYAHEQASMKALYDTVEQWEHKHIIHVFGATGGVRDKTRRTDLGTIAGNRGDILVITDEDPFDEDPQAIIHDIAEAAVATGKKEIKQDLFRNPNRREAIAKALSLAEPGDLVLVTGKGAEQKIARANGTYEDWDDRVVTRELLANRS
ncbi:MAG: UDP-N-acetylmuramoyl-L-alanyl-D-glutamate--2,6-diaminopimelate ligase [Candidatus Doudnabacteria bacterium]|nr:UDP-N-acetylmuramoyl-L-alanyl-D-glutamate--2,6-diaminopimelate ligase [Candidatus Doudnabacteria bacterium]